MRCNCLVVYAQGTHKIVALAVVVRVQDAWLIPDAVQIFVQPVQQERQQLMCIVLQVAFKLRPEPSNRTLRRQETRILCFTQEAHLVRCWTSAIFPGLRRGHRTSRLLGATAEGAAV